MSKVFAAVMLAAVVLSACDKPNDPEPARSQGALISWSEALVHPFTAIRKPG